MKWEICQQIIQMNGAKKKKKTNKHKKKDKIQQLRKNKLPYYSDIYKKKEQTKRILQT